jgi:aminocarboxymuconate-semialdehyde decarboxylase
VQHGFDVRPDLCAKDCKISPRDQLGRFWTDSLVHDPDALRLAVKVFGEDKVCLGTDYPFPLGEYTAESGGTEYSAGHLINSMDYGSDMRRGLLGGNAFDWLGLRPEDFIR